MATDMQKWIGRTARLEEEVKGLAGGPQLAKSSIENGAVLEYDETGQLVSSIGKQYDGSHVAVPLAGPVPPAPVAPSCVTGPGVLEVRWSGKFADGAVSTMDFKNVDVHVSTTSGFEPDLTTQRATIRGELGDVAALAQDAGTCYVRLVSRSLTGKASAPSPEVVAVVPIPADGDAIAEALGQMDEKAQAAKDAADAADTAAGAATTAATDAAAKAQQAKEDAAAAAGIAAGKGKVLVQAAEPGVADRNAATLWIDTTGGANTPKRWTSGTTWVAVTDKVATDAAAKAATAVGDAAGAKSRADAAFTAAGEAMTAAGQAQSSANGKNNVYYRDVVPSGAGFVTGDTVFIRSAVGQPVTAQYQWDGVAWKPVLMGHQVIASVDLGKATVGELDGVRIKAGTVLASSVAVGDFSNLATIDPVRGINITKTAKWATVTDGDYTRGAPGTENYIMFKERTDTVPFKPGDHLRVTFDAVADTPVQAQLAMFLYREKSTGGSSYSAVYDSFLDFGTTEASYSRDFAVGGAASGTYLSWIMGLVGVGGWSGTSTKPIRIRNVTVYRMNGGAMIVDGAFDARTITAPKIQTVTAPNRGLKWLEEGLVAFNGVGTETFRLSATTGEASFLGRVRSGSTIEGADITGASITGGAITMDSGNGYAIDLGTRASSAFIRFRTPTTILGVNEAGTVRGEEDLWYGDPRTSTVIHSPTSTLFDIRGSLRLTAGRSSHPNMARDYEGRAYLNSQLIMEPNSADAKITTVAGKRLIVGPLDGDMLLGARNLDISSWPTGKVTINNITYGQDTDWIFLDLSPGMVARSGAQYRPRARLKDGEVSIVGQIDRGASSINSGGVMLVLPSQFRTDYEVAIPITLATSVNSWIRPNIGEIAVGASSTGGWQVLNVKYTK